MTNRKSRFSLFMLTLILPLPVVPSDNSEQLASRIDQIMQARSGAAEFSGVTLVARRGKAIYEKAFGLANQEWNIPNDLQTKFEIGSMTKQFTAMLVSRRGIVQKL